MSGELIVLVRIGLYIVAGYLASAGLPHEVVQIITTDPSVANLIGQALAAGIALLVYLWSRIAKRLGWTT